MGKLSVLVLLPLAAVAALAVAVTRGGSPRAVSDPPAAVTVQRGVVGRPIPAGFVGLSTELSSLYSYTGSNPRAINPVFEQLVRNLAPGQRPVFRLGGDTTDSTWWPGHDKHQPLGIRYGLTSRWLHVAHALAEGINPNMLIGINLEADSRSLAGAEAHAVVTGIGSRWIGGLELGNEPELYGGLAWYELDGHRFYGRPHNYDFRDFVSDFTRISGALKGAPLAGPNIGSPHWFKYLGPFLRDEPRVKMATLHRYPLKRCSASARLTIGELLAQSSSRGLANTVRRWVGVAHAHHVPVRIDEMNAVSCGGDPGVSNVFASALWSVDALFEMARVGVDGVNIHTRPDVSGELFSFTQKHGTWRAEMHARVLRPVDVRPGHRSRSAPAQGLRVSRRPGQGVGHASRRRSGQCGPDQQEPGPPAHRDAAHRRRLRARDARTPRGTEREREGGRDARWTEDRRRARRAGGSAGDRLGRPPRGPVHGQDAGGERRHAEPAGVVAVRSIS